MLLGRQDGLLGRTAPWDLGTLTWPSEAQLRCLTTEVKGPLSTSRPAVRKAALVNLGAPDRACLEGSVTHVAVLLKLSGDNWLSFRTWC